MEDCDPEGWSTLEGVAETVVHESGPVIVADPPGPGPGPVPGPVPAPVPAPFPLDAEPCW